MNFRQYALNRASELECFSRSDPERWMAFTRRLNDHIALLAPGQKLYVADIVKPVSYNATVKWFCWRSFWSHHHPIEYKRNYFVRYDMAPDYSYITAIHVRQ